MIDDEQEGYIPEREGYIRANMTIHCRACGSGKTGVPEHCYIEEELLYCGRCGMTSVLSPRTIVDYNRDYVARRYDIYPTTEAMSALRLHLLETVMHLYEVLPYQHTPDRLLQIGHGRLLDVGYGNGSFIRHARKSGWDAYGNDINPTEYEGVRRVDLPVGGGATHYRAITFFDSLEHFEKLRDVRMVVEHTDWIMVSCPKPPLGFPMEMQEDWKHYRPGEHHHYFTPDALQYLFSTRDYATQMVYLDAPEDVIRGKLSDGSDNIQTAILRCSRRPSAERMR